MLTRRQRRQQEAATQRQQLELDDTEELEEQLTEEKQRPARKSRISSVVVVQHPSQPAPATQRPTQQRKRQQEQQDGADREGEVAERRQEEPMVVEDLGPEARSNQYEMDWEQRCRAGMEEILRDFMNLEQLTAFVEHITEDWDAQADRCLQEYRMKDGRKQWVAHKRTDPIVKKLMRLLFTGTLEGRTTQNGGGGMSKEGLVEYLQSEFCQEAVKAYVDQRLRLRYQNLPATEDPYCLLWDCWNFPLGPKKPVQDVYLGGREVRYTMVGGHSSDMLEPGNDGSVAWRHVWQALELGDMQLQNQNQLWTWLEQVNLFSQAPKCWVSAMLRRKPGNCTLKLCLYANWPIDRHGSNVVNAAWTRQQIDPDSGLFVEDMAALDLAVLLGQLDEHSGTPLAEEMDRLKAAELRTELQVEARGLDSVLPVGAPLGKGQFDSTIKPLVEAEERPEPDGFKLRCNESFKLEFSTYQRRTVAHMLAEETTPGGSARHLWVKLGLPSQPELHAYVCPTLKQIRFFASKIEAEQCMQSCGGAGLLYLEVGMGKTACAVAITQLNPPPANWRKNRAYQTHRDHDHLAAAVNNMPHGGCLIVVPTAIVNQWEAEFRKTTAARLTICKWVDGTKKQPLNHDCKLLARYDVVITDINTVKSSCNLQTIVSIFWHRVIVDEVQQQGSLLANRDLMATHRWGLSGTPDNDNNLDTMAPLWSFLRLAPHSPIFTHFPPVLTHVLKKSMVFYSKAGKLDGRINLELPPTQDRVLECEMSEEDARWYLDTLDAQREKFFQLLWRARIFPDELRTAVDDPDWEFRKHGLGKSMTAMRGLVVPLRQAASSAFQQPTGVQHYDPATGRYTKEKHCFTSKVEAVLDVLRNKGPSEKVVVFSEFKATSQAIKRRLPELGLDSRDLLGNAKSEKRGTAIAEFQTAPPTQVFFLTHRTGGAGVTLTAGTHVVLCEPVLNPAFEEQAIGRCNRLGQRSTVMVTRLVMKGTIEEKIVEFMAQRGGSGEDAEEGSALVDRSSKLTVEDVHWLVYDTDAVGELGSI